MKKVIVLSIVLILIIAGLALGAGVVTQTKSRLSENVEVINIDIVADASGNIALDASGNATTFSTEAFNGFVFLVTTNPGTPSPTSSYDVYLYDSTDTSLDVMGGQLVDRSPTLSQQLLPKIGGVTVEKGRYVQGGLSVDVSNNTASNAVIGLKIYYNKDIK